MSTPDQTQQAAVSPRRQYLEYCAQGQLAYQYSPSADLAVFYPRTVAPVTGADDLEWRISSGRGVVYATSTVRPRGGEPHNVSLVELEEGFRMMTSVVDIPVDDVHAGMKVTVAFRPIGQDGQLLPVFTKEDAQ